MKNKVLAVLVALSLAFTPVKAAHPDYTATVASATYGKFRPNRLVGVACGPERLTEVAPEEDEFPSGTCEAIGLPVEFGCLPEDTADQCAEYLGLRGW